MSLTLNSQAAPPGWAHSTRRAWLITAMLALFMLINWGDKSVLGLTARALMKDLGLTPSQYGLIASSFFFLFGIGTVLGGFLVDRIKTKPMLLVMAVVWALVQFPVLGGASFAVLLVSRIVLGLAEGPATPVALHAVMKWFPDERRDLPNSIVLAASGLGLLVAAPVMAFVQVHWGWRWCFGVLGIAGLVWAAVWLLVGREGPYDKPVSTAAPELDGAATAPDVAGSASDVIGRVSYWRLFATRTWVCFALAGFGCYFVTALLTTWLPTYLESVREISTISTGNWIAATAATGAIAMFGQGVVSRMLIARGIPTRWARAGVAGIAVVIAGLCMVGFVFTDGTLQLILMLPAFNLFTATFPASSAAVAQITPVAQRGAVLGVLFAFLGAAGVIAPFLAGRLIQAAHQPASGYHTAFLIGAALLIVSGLAVALLANPDRDAVHLAERKAH
ncbi:MFS transporter [Rhodococcus sp. NPDC056960]|uniref:MFS transporter n=1 Tax=Rhodococcus sp. NPDC056960 TaxID=3345982 RepID=UPI003628001A